MTAGTWIMKEDGDLRLVEMMTMTRALEMMTK